MSWKNVQYENGKYRTSEGGGGGGSSTFAGLDDVSFNNLQNGQVPKYNSTTQKWENANESGGGGTVTDVQVDGASVVNPQGVAEIETPNADGIGYDNQQSGLSATDVQSALDELAQGSGGGGVEDVEVNGTSVVNAQNVAEIKSYKEVTQAEYNALPASKTSDDILYCIKDSAGADSYPPLIYSDEEREVGVWRDGKPLYAITLVKTGTFATGSYVSHDVSDLNIDTMVELYGWAERFVEGSNIAIWHPLNYYEGANYSVASRYNATSKTIDIRCAYSSGNLCRTQIFNIYYTKTTDTAGSGQWNTDGTPTHHYSTSEKVIGTWIDGKPLYEKTVDCGSLLTASSSIPHGISNLKRIVSFDGNAVQDNGDLLPIPLVQWGRDVADYQVRVSANSSNIVLSTTSGTVMASVIVTVRYTKTTD